MSKSKFTPRITEQQERTVIVIDVKDINTDERTYSIYLDNNLEVENVEELMNDKELVLYLELTGEKVLFKYIVIENINSELLYTMPEDCADLWQLLNTNATKVDKGVWRLNETCLV
jgi:hypothetical protein